MPDSRLPRMGHTAVVSPQPLACLLTSQRPHSSLQSVLHGEETDVRPLPGPSQHLLPQLMQLSPPLMHCHCCLSVLSKAAGVACSNLILLPQMQLVPITKNLDPGLGVRGSVAEGVLASLRPPAPQGSPAWPRCVCLALALSFSLSSGTIRILAMS